MSVAPKIKFNYMSREEDWEDWRTALRLTREIVDQPCFDGVRGDEIAPGAAAQVRLGSILTGAYLFPSTQARSHHLPILFFLACRSFPSFLLPSFCLFTFPSQLRLMRS